MDEVWTARRKLAPQAAHAFNDWTEHVNADEIYERKGIRDLTWNTPRAKVQRKRSETEYSGTLVTRGAKKAIRSRIQRNLREGIE